MFNKHKRTWEKRTCSVFDLEMLFFIDIKLNVLYAEGTTVLSELVELKGSGLPGKSMFLFKAEYIDYTH